MLSWSSKRQLTIFLIVFLVFIFIIGALAYKYWPAPTCSDGRKNQAEEGVDCGGPCIPCVVNPEEVITRWARVFKLENGLYEVAALLENPNFSYGISNFKYSFLIYDLQNILVAAREGETFLNPLDKLAVFSTNIDTGKSIPVKAYIDIEPVLNWVYLESRNVPVVVSSKNYSNYPFPTLVVRLRNQSLFSVKNINVSAILHNKDENAIAISSTKIDFIGAESEKEAVFTWPAPFSEEVIRSEILVRTNLFEND